MWKKISSFRSSAASTIGLLFTISQYHQAFASTFDGGRNECPCLPLEEVRNAMIDQDVVDREGLDSDALSTFGIGCGHAHGFDSGATICVESRDPGSWCADEWCYVDSRRCELRHTRSDIHPSLSFSFATCGYPDNYVRDPISIRGNVIKAVLADNHHGYQGTICDPGEECYGTMVEFANFLEQEASGLNISLDRVPLPDWITTKAAEYPLFIENNENISHAACVYGTGLSAVDLCIGAYTKNEHRSTLSYFLEMGTTREYLVVFDGTDGISVWEGIQGVLAPFSWSLWILTFVLLFVLSMLFVIQERSCWSSLRDTQTIGIAAYYACLSFFDQGRAFDQEWEIDDANTDGTTWGGRLTLLALAVQILLTGASYTANLTNFLVKDVLSPNIGSINEVVAANLPLCVLRNKMSVLDMSFGENVINYAIDPSDDKMGFHVREELLQAMEDGHCCCAVVGTETLDIEHGKGNHCHKHRIGMPVIELPWGVPVSDKYAPALKTVVTHFIQSGDFSKIERDAKPTSACHGASNKNLKSEQLRPINMLGTYVISGALAVIGILASLVRTARKTSMGILGRSRGTQKKHPDEKESVVDFVDSREAVTATEFSSSNRGNAGSPLRILISSEDSKRDWNNNNSGRSFVHRQSNNGSDNVLKTIRDELADLKQTVVDLKQIVVSKQHQASSHE